MRSANFRSGNCEISRAARHFSWHSQPAAFGAPGPPRTLAATAHQRKDQPMTVPDASPQPPAVERLAGAYITTTTAVAAVTAATALTVAALPAAVLASWREVLPRRRRRR